MKMQSSTHYSSASGTVRTEEPQEDSKKGLLVMQKADEALIKLFQALINRAEQVKERKTHATKFSKIVNILFPSSLDKATVKKIEEISSCAYFCGDAARQGFLPHIEGGERLSNIADQLYEAQLKHPAEFKAALPGLKSRDVSAICNSLVAYRRLRELIASVQFSDPEGMERSINRLCRRLENCGVPKGDVALGNFRNDFLAVAQALRKNPPALASTPA